MFPKIFGMGRQQSKKILKNQFTKNSAGKWIPKADNYTKFGHRYRYIASLLRRPLYEGFGEEGGQAWANLSGQLAAEYFYTNGENPDSKRAIAELVNHSFKSDEFESWKLDSEKIEYRN